MATTTIIVCSLDPTSPGPSTGTSADTSSALRRHARAATEQAGGRVARAEGDIIAFFDGTQEALTAASLVQQACAGPASGVGSGRVRVGVHVGEVPRGVATGTDNFGAVVATASELAGQAEGGQIVVSALVHLLASGRPGLQFEPVTAGVTWRLLWQEHDAPPTVRAVVADDVALVRAGISRLLADDGFDIVGEAADYDGLVALARRERPDLVVTDIRMPPSQTDEGLRAAALLRGEQPDIAVVVVSQHVEPAAAALLLDGNPTAVGYLLKERVADLDEFVATCRAVAAGGCVIDPDVTARLVAAPASRPLERLTATERGVLDLMAQGRSNLAIARELICSPKTVEAHVRSIFTKLDLADHPDDNRRVAAVVRWLHRGPTA